MRAKLVVFGLLIAFGGLLIAGCGNPCKKAADHYLSCLEEVCSDNGDLPYCGEDTRNAMEAEYEGQEEVECVDEFEAQATAMLEQDCAALFPDPNAGAEESEGE